MIHLNDSVLLTIVSSPEKKLAFTNFAYVNDKTFQALKLLKEGSKATTSSGDIRCELKKIVLNIRVNSSVGDMCIALSQPHRLSAAVNVNDTVLVQPWVAKPSLADYAAQEIKCHIGTVLRHQSAEVIEEDLEKEIQTIYKDHVLTVGQTFAILNPTDNIIISFTVSEIEKLRLPVSKDYNEGTHLNRGVIIESTDIVFSIAEGFNITLKSNTTRCKNLFGREFDFQQLGVGGLDKEFSDIFRRAFASRIFPASVLKELGIQHVRGMLLYGPPGTGKTLIARQISHALRTREPKIVNGPEILNKYVGQSEENIRNLFKDAEDDYKKKGDASPLHTIILDEIDAICKQRGTTASSTGVNDSIVNQLLSKIDGVNSLNNILLIGMTNRLDMIDEALLRPGRLEVHIEIGLPNLQGRLQILSIHTNTMSNSKRLCSDVSLPNLAEKTRNFSGAELAGLVRSAASYAFSRNVDVKDLSHTPDISSLQLCQSDFDMALGEIKPAFGVQMDELEACLTCGIIEYSDAFKILQASLATFAQQVRDSPNTPLLSCLLLGESGTGKTALAAFTALNADSPFVKFVSPEQFVGFTEYARVSAIKGFFEDAYKSDFGIIILDNLERLMDYTPIGSRFSNMILQALLVLVKKKPTKHGHRLLVLATSSESDFMRHSGITSSFNIVLDVPPLTSTNHIKKVLQVASAKKKNFPDTEIDYVCEHLKQSLPIKQMLLIYEMATESCRHDDFLKGEKFMACVEDCGL